MRPPMLIAMLNDPETVAGEVNVHTKLVGLEAVTDVQAAELPRVTLMVVPRGPKPKPATVMAVASIAAYSTVDWAVMTG